MLCSGSKVYDYVNDEMVGLTLIYGDCQTAGRNVAFEVSTMGESLLAAQSVVLTCEVPKSPSSLDDEEVGFGGFGL